MTLSNNDRALHLRKLELGQTDQWIEVSSSERTKISRARRRMALDRLSHEDFTVKQWSDYQDLVKYEIDGVRQALTRAILRNWDSYANQHPKLLQKYNELQLSKRGQNLPTEKHRLYWLKRVAVRELCTDLYELGKLEELVFRSVYFGFEE